MFSAYFFVPVQGLLAPGQIWQVVVLKPTSVRRSSTAAGKSVGSTGQLQDPGRMLTVTISHIVRLLCLYGVWGIRRGKTSLVWFGSNLNLNYKRSFKLKILIFQLTWGFIHWDCIRLPTYIWPVFSRKISSLFVVNGSVLPESCYAPSWTMLHCGCGWHFSCICLCMDRLNRCLARRSRLMWYLCFSDTLYSCSSLHLVRDNIKWSW